MKLDKKKNVSPFEIFENVSNVIKNRLISEAIAMNENTGFMEKEEFEEKIKQLDNWQIAEISKDIALWNAVKETNINLRRMRAEEEQKNVSNEIIESFKKKMRGVH